MCVAQHTACMALCSCNLFEGWVFHWAAGCRALDPWQNSSSIWAWPKTRWLCMCDHHPAPPFLPLTPTYMAAASGIAYQVLPLVILTAAQVLLFIGSKCYLSATWPSLGPKAACSLIKSTLISCGSQRETSQLTGSSMCNHKFDVPYTTYKTLPFCEELYCDSKTVVNTQQTIIWLVDGPMLLAINEAIQPQGETEHSGIWSPDPYLNSQINT